MWQHMFCVLVMRAVWMRDLLFIQIL